MESLGSPVGHAGSVNNCTFTPSQLNFELVGQPIPFTHKLAARFVFFGSNVFGLTEENFGAAAAADGDQRPKQGEDHYSLLHFQTPLYLLPLLIGQG